MIRTSRIGVAALSAVASVALLAPTPAFANHSGPSSPVVGYIQIVNTGAGPTYTAYGALGNSSLWTCSSNAPLVPYEVTCTPTALATVNLQWHCDVLHGDVHGLSATARARTSMDCNGDGNWEAQTAVVFGPLYDYVWATSAMTVTKFTCRVDGGTNFPGTTPNYRAGCGDPGLVRLH